MALRSPAESQDTGLTSGTPRRPAAQTEMPPGDGGFRSIDENIPQGILIALGFNGPHLYANRCATELTGYSIAELLQLGPAYLVPLWDSPPYPATPGTAADRGGSARELSGNPSAQGRAGHAG